MMNTSPANSNQWCLRVKQKDGSEQVTTGLTRGQAIRRANKITNQCIQPWEEVSWGLTKEVAPYARTV